MDREARRYNAMIDNGSAIPPTMNRRRSGRLTLAHPNGDIGGAKMNGSRMLLNGKQLHEIALQIHCVRGGTSRSSERRENFVFDVYRRARDTRSVTKEPYEVERRFHRIDVGA